MRADPTRQDRAERFVRTALKLAVMSTFSPFRELSFSDGRPKITHPIPRRETGNTQKRNAVRQLPRPAR